MKRIYGPTYNAKLGKYEWITNVDIENFYNEPNIQKCLVFKDYSAPGIYEKLK